MRALTQLAALDVSAGSADADRLSAEALMLGACTEGVELAVTVNPRALICAPACTEARVELLS